MNSINCQGGESIMNEVQEGIFNFAKLLWNVILQNWWIIAIVIAVFLILSLISIKKKK